MTIVAGIDIQPVVEVKESVRRFGDRYLRRIYSARELLECEAVLANVAESLAGRFAAKEAFLKVLRPDDHIPSWRTIEVLLPFGEDPRIVLSGEAETLARERGIGLVSLSVSLAHDFAIAAVLADVTQPDTKNATGTVREHLIEDPKGLNEWSS
jgi:holo-[acyl-carrier protein] synthase